MGNNTSNFGSHGENISKREAEEAPPIAPPAWEPWQRLLQEGQGWIGGWSPCKWTRQDLRPQLLRLVQISHTHTHTHKCKTLLKLKHVQKLNPSDLVEGRMPGGTFPKSVELREANVPTLIRHPQTETWDLLSQCTHISQSSIAVNLNAKYTSELPGGAFEKNNNQVHVQQF